METQLLSMIFYHPIVNFSLGAIALRSICTSNLGYRQNVSKMSANLTSTVMTLNKEFDKAQDHLHSIAHLCGQAEERIRKSQALQNDLARWESTHDVLIS